MNNVNERPTHDELKEAAKPLHEILCKYYHPHATVIVTQANVEIVEGDISAPLPIPD